MARKSQDPAQAFGPDAAEVALSQNVKLLAERLGVPEIVTNDPSTPYRPDVLVDACLKVTAELASLQRELTRIADALEDRERAVEAREKAVKWAEERVSALSKMVTALTPSRAPGAVPALPAPRGKFLAAIRSFTL